MDKGKRKKGKENKKPKKQKIDCEKLISEVQNHPCIWDKSSPLYKDKGKTFLAWKSVASTMKMPEAELKARWKNLGDSFRRILDTACGRSGDGLDEDKLEAVTWTYFKSMLYFKDSFLRRRTVSSYEDNDSEFGEDQSDDSVQDSGTDAFDSNVTEMSESNGGSSTRSESSNPLSSVSQLDSSPSPSNCSAKVAKKKRSSVKKSNTDDVIEKLVSNCERISQTVADTTTDPNQKFLAYLGESLKLVPGERMRRCERALLDLVNSYIEGIEVQVSPSQSIFVDPSQVVMTESEIDSGGFSQ